MADHVLTGEPLQFREGGRLFGILTLPRMTSRDAFLPPRERGVPGLDTRDKRLEFFNCWTRKEAFVKALGDGLSIR